MGDVLVVDAVLLSSKPKVDEKSAWEIIQRNGGSIECSARNIKGDILEPKGVVVIFLETIFSGTEEKEVSNDK